MEFICIKILGLNINKVNVELYDQKSGCYDNPDWRSWAGLIAIDNFQNIFW